MDKKIIKNKIIDLHVHYPALNPALVNERYLSNFNRFLLYQITMRIYCKYLGIKYTKKLKKLRREAEKVLIEKINNSKLDYSVVFGIEGGNSFLWCDNNYVFTLNEKCSKILPGVSINPIKPTAIQELKYFANLGAALVKVHPTFQNFNPNSGVFINFCREAKKLKIPILTHVGYESAIPGMKQGLKQYNDISHFIRALKTGCKIIAAHGGGSPLNFFGSERKYLLKVKYLVRKYPNLFLDISAVYNIHRPNRALGLLSDKNLLNRCVYGSDYPNISKGEKLIFKIGFKNYFNLMRNKNIFDRDIETKKLLGFDNKIFSRGLEIINPIALNRFVQSN